MTKKDQGGEKTTSEFFFSNPLIRTVHLDKILPDDRDGYMKIEIVDRENSPCFCFHQDLKILPCFCSEEDVEKTTYILVHI